MDSAPATSSMHQVAKFASDLDFESSSFKDLVTAQITPSPLTEKDLNALMAGFAQDADCAPKYNGLPRSSSSVPSHPVNPMLPGLSPALHSLGMSLLSPMLDAASLSMISVPEPGFKQESDEDDDDFDIKPDVSGRSDSELQQIIDTFDMFNMTRLDYTRWKQRNELGLTKNELDRLHKIRRRFQNKRAAKKTRSTTRQKQQRIQLQRHELENQNTSLKQQVASLRDDNTRLRDENAHLRALLKQASAKHIGSSA